MERFLQAETLFIELLLVVTLVAILVRRLRVPYTVALVVVGLLITFQSPLEIELTPELILALFVPPLVFEAEELDTGWRELLRARRGALLGLRRDGIISEEVFEKLTSEVDFLLNEPQAPIASTS